MPAACEPVSAPERLFLSAREASRQLGGRPSHPTIGRLVEEGKIPGATRFGRVIMVPRAWVEQILSGKPTFLR